MLFLKYQPFFPAERFDRGIAPLARYQDLFFFTEKHLTFIGLPQTA
jgi:hypothetical protein